MDLTFSNSFEGGRNSDTDPNKLGNNQYLSAFNTELVGSGLFTSLQNIKGTTEIGSINNDASTTVYKVLRNNWLIDNTSVECLTVFTVVFEASVFYFRIFCVTPLGFVYEVFSEVTNPTITTVDARTYAEGGVDLVYFTDNSHEVRALRCEIPSPYSANFLNAYDLSLQRKGANGTITYSGTDSGGTLLSGTYQFAYRMCDPDNKKFTKWSSLTAPIHVYDKANSTSPVYSGIGLVTNRKITLSLTPSYEESANLGYIQLAVLENVGPTPPISASLLEIEAFSGPSMSYEYKSNSRIGSIPLEDIVVDLAQIQSAKTLSVKENRLFLGNLNYTALELDNGYPQITSGTVSAATSLSNTDPFSDDNFATTTKGYWRGEVYRFGVVYRDEFGNASPAYPLDLSGVTGNQISGGLTDMKFPDRSTSNAYTLFSVGGRIQSLGLALSGLVNHPSWARSLEIVRVNRTGRLKNILFQSPVIPMTTVYGLGAYDTYPQTYVSLSSGATTTEEDAQPQTSGFILSPKNLLWPEMRGYTFNTNNVTYTHVGASTGYQFSMLFPPGSMYTNDGTAPADQFVYTGSEKLDFVDFALLRLNYEDKSPSKSPTVVIGDDINTNISGNFYALAGSQYYFDPTFLGKSISSTYRNIPITGYKFFSNLGQPDVLDGASVMDYEAMQTPGVDWGYKPDIMKSAVVKLGGSVVPDIMTSGAAFNAGTLNAYSAGGYVVGASGIQYQSTRTNKFVPTYSGFTEDSSYCQAVGIVNVKLGLGDDRYGSFTDLHEYISTGAKYTFSEAEVTTLEAGGSVSVDLTVFGGDCFVGPQLFKISNGTFSIVGQGDGSPTTAQYLSKWKKFYKPTSGTIFNQPIGIEGVAQYVEVVLESDFNGEVRDNDSVVATTTVSGIPVYNNNTRESIRTPLTYKYNTNLNQQNSQKIYVSKPEFSFEQNEFSARIAYSDLKIYNSSEAGFDIFRVSNIYDLEEQYGPITKLAIAGDAMYGIQERGTTYLPTGERQIEATDAGTLAVRSGDVIGRPSVIDATRGSQHQRSIIETGQVIYLADALNRNVYSLSEQSLKPITKDNESIFRSFFASNIDEADLLGVYDPIRHEYWLGHDGDFHVYSERGFWVGAYEFPEDLMGAAYLSSGLYLLGDSASGLKLYTMYTNSQTSLFGTLVTPRVTISVNPEPDFTKTFDDLMLSATERISSTDFVVYNESQIGNQTASASLDISTYGNNYRIKNPRAANGARLRGLYCLLTLNFKNTIQSALRTVGTKYRRTSRYPW